MQVAEFIEYHQPALEVNEIKYNLILGLLASPANAGLRLWSMGNPGECAIQHPGYPIVLGALTREQCLRLADDTVALDHAGVVGADDTAEWFVDRVVQHGIRFHEPVPQQIQMLTTTPIYPGSDGAARNVGAGDATLFTEWMLAFYEEAVPEEQKPSSQQLQAAAGSESYSFWIANGEPVSMAGIRRRTRHVGAISGVYTPPILRGRGYAGSVTAAVVERIFGEGKTAACLYTDLRNPYSNRCYAKVGFKPICLSSHYVRLAEAKDSR
jgi:predicted GNAT family acetyltransferase